METGTTDLTRREPELVEKDEKKTQREGLVFVPRADIVETTDAVVLTADMPGVDDGSVDITVENRVLTIVGRVDTDAPEGYRLGYREYRTGDYQVSFRLSDAIDPDKITATVKDGVLKLELSKAETARSRKIDVKSL